MKAGRAIMRGKARGEPRISATVTVITCQRIEKEVISLSRAKIRLSDLVARVMIHGKAQT